MMEDDFGFLRPKINYDKCILCNSCIKTCPINNSIEKKSIVKAYAAWSKNFEDRESSTSGGVASVFSKYIIENNGVVYGASWVDGAVKHIRVNNVNDLELLKGSKYVSSEIGLIFRAVKEDLRAGLQVLFIGTPCQISGLKRYLSKQYENLYLVDIICHGTPSQKLLRSHLKSCIRKENFKSIKFREGGKYLLKIINDDNVVLYSKDFPFDSYTYGFSYNLFHRESCYCCKYACKERISDVTIGDFWGLGKFVPFKHSKEKVSVVLVNNEKGQLLLDCTSQKLFLEERSIGEAVDGNSQLQHPSIKHKYYNVFRYLYKKFGFNTSVKICMIEFYIKYYISEIIKKL